MADLEKDYISGITFSGGDPLHPENRADVEALIREIKEKYPRKTIWLYTGFDFNTNLCQGTYIHAKKPLDVIIYISV